MGKLTALKVKNLKVAGRFGDGDGLMLDVKTSGAKSWVVRLQRDGRRRDFGLGSTKDVTLEQARDLARDYRRRVRLGRDPAAERRRQFQSVPTFEAAARELYGESKGSWRNGKHVKQWMSTLEKDAFPAIGDMPVDAVATEHVRDLLARIWLTKPETARRVRQRVNMVMEYAQGKGWRSLAFPMQVVNRALPKQPKRGIGFKALPYSGVPAFLLALRVRTSVGRLALEALILTACRSGEIRGARWDEVDFEAKKWTIPAKRMKTNVNHTIPLSSAALDVFRRAKLLLTLESDLVFPGLKPKKPLSDMALLKVVRDAGVDGTVHGFRSSFRDWGAEKSGVPGEVIEAALSHTNPNKTEAAYLRTTFFDQRVPLMENWCRFCFNSASGVPA